MTGGFCDNFDKTPSGKISTFFKAALAAEVNNLAQSHAQSREPLLSILC
jgi:hypothetical protein